MLHPMNRDARQDLDRAGAQRLQPFYVLVETPCPYLPGRKERKLATEISGPDAAALYDRLSRAGFRRSHSFAYRPACRSCAACVPVRVLADRFRPSSSLRRVWRINEDLAALSRPPRATSEQFALFTRYLSARHGEGDMAGMSFGEYRTMVEESRLDTRVIEFRDPSGALVAACLGDWLSDGPSAVYSFFEPAQERRSLGSYMVLWLIEQARLAGLPHTYLGYWIAGAPKMAYKARFRPIEGLGPDGWRLLEARLGERVNPEPP